MDDEKESSTRQRRRTSPLTKRCKNPKEPTSVASTDKLKGGKEAADKFVDQAKKQ